MSDVLKVRLVGKSKASGSAMPWIALRFEDAETGRIIPVAQDSIVLRNMDNAVVAEVSLLIHAVEIDDVCMQSIGDTVEMIPRDTAQRLAVMNGVLVCQCHAIKPEDQVSIVQALSGDVDTKKE